MILPYTGQTIPDLFTTGSAYAQQQQNWDIFIDSVIGQSTTPSNININNSLPFNNNNASSVRSVQFFNQGSQLTGTTDYNSLYFLSGNLYAIDIAGNQIKITAGGTLNASLLGGITGLAGTPASVVYFQPSALFQFFQSGSTNNLANISASQGYFANISASSIYSPGVISASQGQFSTLTASNLNASNALIATLTASNVSASNAYFGVLTASIIIGTVTSSLVTAPIGNFVTLSGTNTYVQQRLSASVVIADILSASLTGVFGSITSSGDINAVGGFKYALNSVLLSTGGTTIFPVPTNVPVPATSGSIVGITAKLQSGGIITGTGSLFMNVIKNNVMMNIPTVIFTQSCPINYGQFVTASFPKDLYTFGPGDTMWVQVTSSNFNPTQAPCSVTLFVES